MSQGNRVPFEGMLNCWQGDFDMPDLLLAISRSGKTGHLVFVNPEGKKNLFVKEGRFIFAESSSQDYQLREFLLKRGTISSWDYNELGKSVRPGKRFGALLVEAGLLKVEELVPAVVGQVREIILGLFNRTETAYAFKEQKLSRHESITLKMPVDQLIVDGILRISSWRRISRGAGDFEQAYEIDHAFDDRIAKVEINEKGEELLQLLETPHSLAELSRLSSLSDFQVGQYLWAFRSLQWAKLSESETASSVSAAADTIDTVEDEDLVAATASGSESVASLPPPTIDDKADDDDDDVAAAAAAAAEIASMEMETEQEDPFASIPTVDEPPPPTPAIEASEPIPNVKDDKEDEDDDIAAEIAAAAAALEAATADELEEPVAANKEPVEESDPASAPERDEPEARVAQPSKTVKKKKASDKTKKKVKKVKKAAPAAASEEPPEVLDEPTPKSKGDEGKKEKMTWVERIAAAASDSDLDEKVGFTDVSFDEEDSLSGDDEFATSIDGNS